MNKKLQIIYPTCLKNTSGIHEYFLAEANAMINVGLDVGTIPFNDATQLLYRGFTINNKHDYPYDFRYINCYDQYIIFSNISFYYQYIHDLTIETFFSDKLDESVISELGKRKWNKAFIKRESRALESFIDGKSIWPDTSFVEMTKLYDTYNINGKFAIRKYVEKDIIKKEERYWVINGKIYHRFSRIPSVVKEVVSRLSQFGSKYYTIDATPSFVIEVNPGESSDRLAVNSPEMFANWFKNEFS
jgi:hypothetical protein